MATLLTVQHPQFGGKLNLRGTEGRKVRVRGSGRKEQLDDTSMTPSSEDPLRILAPGQKKLSTIESQRVLAVMEEAIKKMNNAMLIPIFAGSLERYSVSLGAELVGMLNEYSHLTIEYHKLYSELEQRGRAPSLDDSNGSGDVYIKVEEQRGSTSNITGPGYPTRLNPLELEQGPQATEARFQQVRFKLKHLVKCIVRALHGNPSTTSAASTAPGTTRNAMLLQEEMR